MKIQTKIQALLKEKKWNLSVFHKKIIAHFGRKSIAYLTLYRTINGHTQMRATTLTQIATALNLSPEKLTEGTCLESMTNQINYDKNNFLKIDKNNLGFTTARLHLNPGGKTPAEKESSIKWIYGLQGEITCLMATENGEERRVIRKNEHFGFSCHYPHHFENNSKRKAVCLLINNPQP